MQRYYKIVYKYFLVITHQKVFLNNIIQTKSILIKLIFQQIYLNINHVTLNLFLTKIKII